jgi:hypothetical protein
MDIVAIRWTAVHGPLSEEAYIWLLFDYIENMTDQLGGIRKILPLACYL